MKMTIASFLCILLIPSSVHAQETFPLYTGKIPNSKPNMVKELRQANALVDSLVSGINIPTLTIFRPEKPNGTAVVICPGGGYGTLLIKREGGDPARALNKLGVTAFVLKYRLPDDRILIDKSIGPLQDAQTAIRLVRKNALKWKVDPARIGVMGYSAGGHLASTVGTHFKTPVSDTLEDISARPDFMILVNPVISFSDEFGHIGSRDNLLGKLAQQQKIDLYSNEKQVDRDTPPSILLHAGTDEVVPVANSMTFYRQSLHHGVSSELHVYSQGEHGFLTYPLFDEWFARCASWLRRMRYAAAAETGKQDNP